MEFEENQRKSFQVLEFYRHFRSCLPKIAKIVSQGYRGSSDKDTLYQDEIIVVVEKTHSGNTVSKHGGESMEVYRIEDGVLAENPIYLPVNIPILLIAEVTGIKGQTKEQWKAYQQDIQGRFAGPEHTVGYQDASDEYERFESLHIPPKKTKGLHQKIYVKTVGKMKKKLENNEKANVANLNETQNETVRSLSEENQELMPNDCRSSVDDKKIERSVEICDDNERPVTCHSNRNKRPPIAQKPLFVPKPNVSNISVIDELDKALKLRKTNPKPEGPFYENNIQRSLVRPFTETINKTDPDSECQKQGRGKMNSENCVDSDRIYGNLLGVLHCETEHSGNPKNESPSYVNKLMSENTLPTGQMYLPLKPTAESNSQYLYVGVKTETQAEMKTMLTPEEVASLTVENVSEYLKLLNLHKLVDEFEEQQVDGTLLASLDEDILTSEFKLKRLEAKKLMNFAREGRLPLSRKTQI